MLGCPLGDILSVQEAKFQYILTLYKSLFVFPEGANEAEYFWQMRVAKEK